MINTGYLARVVLHCPNKETVHTEIPVYKNGDYYIVMAFCVSSSLPLTIGANWFISNKTYTITITDYIPNEETNSNATHQS